MTDATTNGSASLDVQKREMENDPKSGRAQATLRCVLRRLNEGGFSVVVEERTQGLGWLIMRVTIDGAPFRVHATCEHGKGTVVFEERVGGRRRLRRFTEPGSGWAVEHIVERVLDALSKRHAREVCAKARRERFAERDAERASLQACAGGDNRIDVTYGPNGAWVVRVSLAWNMKKQVERVIYATRQALDS